MRGSLQVHFVTITMVRRIMKSKIDKGASSFSLIALLRRVSLEKKNLNVTLNEDKST